MAMLSRGSTHLVVMMWGMGLLVNSETGHSEDQQPNLRHALGSVKRVKVRATGDLRAHPPEVVGHRPALPAFPRIQDQCGECWERWASLSSPPQASKHTYRDRHVTGVFLPVCPHVVKSLTHSDVWH
jgi:hypothetical protein